MKKFLLYDMKKKSIYLLVVKQNIISKLASSEVDHDDFMNKKGICLYQFLMNTLLITN